MNNKTGKQVEETFSNCCGAEASKLSDSLCGDCLEHADFE